MCSCPCLDDTELGKGVMVCSDNYMDSAGPIVCHNRSEEIEDKSTKSASEGYGA
jgi:hypothetical protein